MPKQYPRELRERAVRLVAEHRGDYETEYAAIRSVAAKLGIATAGDPAQVGPPGRGRRRARGRRDAARSRREIRQLRAENASCAGPTRSSRRRRLSSRPSSTGHSHARQVHRRAQEGVRGRADLPRAHRARLQIAPSTYYAARSRPASARAVRDEQLKAEITPGLAGQLRGLRRGEGLAGAEPPGHRRRPVHGRAADARPGPARRPPRPRRSAPRSRARTGSGPVTC